MADMAGALEITAPVRGSFLLVNALRGVGKLVYKASLRRTR
jgi:hypothetical protein